MIKLINFLQIIYKSKNMIIGQENIIKEHKKIGLVIYTNDLNLKVLKKFKEITSEKLLKINISSSELKLSNKNIKIIALTDKKIIEKIKSLLKG